MQENPIQNLKTMSSYRFIIHHDGGHQEYELQQQTASRQYGRHIAHVHIKLKPGGVNPTRSPRFASITAGPDSDVSQGTPAVRMHTMELIRKRRRRKRNPIKRRASPKRQAGRRQRAGAYPAVTGGQEGESARERNTNAGRRRSAADGHTIGPD